MLFVCLFTFKLMMVVAAVAIIFVNPCLLISSLSIVCALSRLPPFFKKLSSTAFAVSLIMVSVLDR